MPPFPFPLYPASLLIVLVVALGVALGMLVAAARRRRRRGTGRGDPGVRPQAGRSLWQSLQRSRDQMKERLGSVLARDATAGAVLAEIEDVLLGADLGVACTGLVLDELRRRWRPGASQPETLGLLAAILRERLPSPPAEPGGGPGPRVTLVVGVNGVGKTTSVGKLAYRRSRSGAKVLLVAADTFRAAAAEQLAAWAERAGADVVAQSPGGDPSAVVFDGLRAARSRGRDAVIIDTAGRLHTKRNLVEELRKIRRVIGASDPEAPHETLLVLDATTGQNGLAQARTFQEALGLTGVLLAKLDGTAKGGIVFAIAEELGLPVCYVGTGEGIGDMARFDPEEFVRGLVGAPAGGAAQALTRAAADR